MVNDFRLGALRYGTGTFGQDPRWLHYRTVLAELDLKVDQLFLECLVQVLIDEVGPFGDVPLTFLAASANTHHCLVCLAHAFESLVEDQADSSLVASKIGTPSYLGAAGHQHPERIHFPPFVEISQRSMLHICIKLLRHLDFRSELYGPDPGSVNQDWHVLRLFNDEGPQILDGRSIEDFEHVGVDRSGDLRWPVLADVEAELREYLSLEGVLLSIRAGSREADRGAFVKQLLELARIAEDQLIGLIDEDHVALADLEAGVGVIPDRRLIPPVDPVVLEVGLIPSKQPLDRNDDVHDLGHLGAQQHVRGPVDDPALTHGEVEQPQLTPYRSSPYGQHPRDGFLQLIWPQPDLAQHQCGLGSRILA